MFLLYNFLLSILSPIWVPWMLFRTSRRREKPNWKERMGDYRQRLPPRKESGPRLWVHAVSVGEVLASKPILTELRRTLPNHEIILTVTTSSGHQTARDLERGLFDHLLYFPIDVARFQLSAMQRVQPDAVIIMETELWMNFLWAAKTFDAKTFLVNGRISDRAFPRSMRIRAYYRALLAMVDRSLMQTQTDVHRLAQLGASHAEVFGNCKFDQAIQGTKADPAHWVQELGLEAGKPTIVVGSARAEEFIGLAAELAPLAATCQIIIAPRHLERTTELIAALLQRGTKTRSRSEGQKAAPGEVLILDTYGELGDVYSVADIAVVGGGFANLGGQNLLQPLALGKPVLHGPNMQNFRDVADIAVKSGASRICSTNDTNYPRLNEALQELLDSPKDCEAMGRHAAQLVKQNTGASKRYAEAIASSLSKKTK